MGKDRESKELNMALATRLHVIYSKVYYSYAVERSALGHLRVKMNTHLEGSLMLLRLLLLQAVLVSSEVQGEHWLVRVVIST